MDTTNHHHQDQNRDRDRAPGQELIPTPAPGPWAGPPPGPAPHTAPGPDPGLGGEDDDTPGAQVRLWTTEQLQALVRSLRPYVDGTLGDVSPRHAAVAVQAVRELNRLWGAYWKPAPVVEEVPDEEQVQRVAQERAAVTRARVLERLQELRDRAQ